MGFYGNFWDFLEKVYRILGVIYPSITHGVHALLIAGRKYTPTQRYGWRTKDLWRLILRVCLTEGSVSLSIWLPERIMTLSSYMQAAGISFLLKHRYTVYICHHFQTLRPFSQRLSVTNVLGGRLICWSSGLSNPPCGKQVSNGLAWVLEAHKRRIEMRLNVLNSICLNSPFCYGG